MRLWFAQIGQQLYDPLEYAIRFFAAATPFLTSLALFVALLIILLRLRPPRRGPTSPPGTEGEERDRMLELLDVLRKHIL